MEATPHWLMTHASLPLSPLPVRQQDHDHTPSLVRVIDGARSSAVVGRWISPPQTVRTRWRGPDDAKWVGSQVREPGRWGSTQSIGASGSASLLQPSKYPGLWFMA